MSETRCFGCMNLKQSYPVCEHCGHDQRIPNAPHQLPPGTVLRDQYVVGRVLGQGGFGITYIGWDLFLDIPVAIKEYYPNTVVTRNCTVSTSVFLRSEDSKDLFVRNRDRFAREARSLARLGAEGQMPNIVRVQNLVQANDTAYIIMEYVRGIDLRSYMLKKGGILSPEEMIRLLHPVMESLEKLHGHNIIHRDLSPDNIMVLPTGDTKLIDFGAVHEVKQDEQGYQLSTEVIVKHGFAPPEQYTRKGRLGPWTDVYAMSATVYYSLTGKVPPSATDRQFEGEPIDWSGVDPRFRAALEKGLTLRIEDRFQSIAELLDSLSAVPIQKKPEEKKKPAPARKKEAPQAVLPTTETVGETKKPKRKKWPILAGAAVAALAIAAGLVFFDSLKKENIATPPAEEQQVSTLSTEVWTAPNLPVSTFGNWEDNVLMHTYNGFSSDNDADYHDMKVYRSDIKNNQILSVTFLPTLEEEPDDSWDVSANLDGSVKAWARQNGELYDLYIAANGGINGREACENMFRKFTKLRRVSFNDSFCTDYATSMRSMFHGCLYLQDIDVSGFNTEKVTDMTYMFFNCLKITDMNVSGFNREALCTAKFMFYNTEKLTNITLPWIQSGDLKCSSFMDTKDTINGVRWTEYSQKSEKVN